MKLSNICFFLIYSFQHVYAQNDTCISFDSLLLCNNINTCPENYHVCNTYDIDILLNNEKHFTNITSSYFTNIGSNNNNCELCEYNKLNNMVTVEPLLEDTTYKNAEFDTYTDKYCMIDNKRIRYGYGVKLNKCLMCICNNKQTQCVNTCNYNVENKFITSIETGINNCVGLKKSNPEKITCLEYIKHQPKNLACCVDNACKLKNCKSCMSYGTVEKCNICDEGYYFNMYSRNKCHNLEQIYEICNGYYSLDFETHIFKCVKCIHGNLEYNKTTYDYNCVCDKEYFGIECSENYNIKKCSGNGVYDVKNKYCICDVEFSGKNCEENIFHNCLNGFFSRNKGGCVCDYGFKGEKCDKKVNCNHGKVVLNKCICKDGFSGENCEIPFPETDFVKMEKSYGNILISSYNANQCKNGVFINGTCNCFNGFSGSDCGSSICNYGNYKPDINECQCIDGYYGNNCEFNCFERCSYNGNICKKNNFGKCICNNGWYGDTCNIFKIKNVKHTSNFSLTNSITIPYITNNFNFSLHILENKAINALPFKIKNEQISIGKKNIRQLGENPVQTLVINTNIGLIEQDDVYYIYPDNNFSQSYYSGKIVNINTHSSKKYFVYIEKIRVEDRHRYFGVTNYSIPLGNNDTNSDTNNNNDTISENEINNSKKMNEFLVNNNWLIISGCVILLIIILYVNICCCCKKKVINVLDNDDTNIYDREKQQLELTMNSNPLFHSRKSTHYSIRSIPTIQSLQIYKHKTLHLPKNANNNNNV